MADWRDLREYRRVIAYNARASRCQPSDWDRPDPWAGPVYWYQVAQARLWGRRN